MEKKIRSDKASLLYSDSTWMYLNSLRKSHLMDRGEEVQFAVLLKYAQYHILSRAFRDKSMLGILQNLVLKLQEGAIKISDIINIKNNFTEKKASIKFISDVTNLLKKWAELKNSTNDVLEEEYLHDCLNLCLHDHQIKHIIQKYKNLEKSDSDALELAHWQQVEEQAKCALIESNVRLVVSVAKHYVSAENNLNDIIQEGNKGLIAAVDLFDYRLGYKFSTYAIWWIRQAITRYLKEKGRLVHIPTNALQISSKIDKYSEEFLNKHGRSPASEDIAMDLEIPLYKVKAALEGTYSITHLDAPFKNHEDTTLQDMLESPNSDSPFSKMALDDLKRIISSILESLSYQEKQTIVMRFGLDTGRTKTLEEVSKVLHLTNERIRQIEIKALKKLRKIKHIQKLAPWCEGLNGKVQFDNEGLNA